MEQISSYNQELSLRLQQDIAKYNEVSQIYRKLDFVGYINQIYDLFYNIYFSEYQFTVQELKKLEQQESNLGQPFDFVEKYQINSLIFKSNFQVICNSINDYLWVLFFNKIQSECSKDHKISETNNNNNLSHKNEQNIQKETLNNESNIQQINESLQQLQQQSQQIPQQQQQQQNFAQNKQQFNNLSNQQGQINKDINNFDIIRDEMQRLNQDKKNYSQQQQQQQSQQLQQQSQLQQQQVSTNYDNLIQKSREDIIRESFMEDQQEKLNKYLAYPSRVNLNMNAQTNMSVSNLQKNLEWIVQNYPDLDKVVNQAVPIIRKDYQIRMDDFAKPIHDSIDYTSSESDIQQMRMITLLLEGQKFNNEPSIPLEGTYQQLKNQHFERKFSTVKASEFNEIYSQSQSQLNKDKLQQQQQYQQQQLSSQISPIQSKQGTQSLRESIYSTNSIHKDHPFMTMPKQSPEVQKLYSNKNSSTNFYNNNNNMNSNNNNFNNIAINEINNIHKKQFSENVIFYEMDQMSNNQQKKKVLPQSGSQSTRNLSSATTSNNKRYQSYGQSKTPKAQLYDYSNKNADNHGMGKFNKYK